MKRAFISLLFGAMTVLSFAQEGVKVTTYQFAEKEGQALNMDVYVDSTAWKDEALHPVFIFSFGGSWEHGTRKDGKAILEDFARHGYLSVGIDYRLGVRKAKEQGVQVNAETFGQVYSNAIAMGIEDLFDATAYVISHAGEWKVDPQRIVVCGSSAGAINTLTAEYLICNNHPLASQHLPEGFNYAVAIPLAGGVWIMDTDSLVWQKKPCPILAYHGTKDQLVPYGNIVLAGGAGGGFGPDYFIPQLKQMQVPYLFHSYKDCDHIIAMIHGSKSAREEMLSAINKVVEEKLTLTSTIMDEFYGDVPSLVNFFDAIDLLGIEWEMPNH